MYNIISFTYTPYANHVYCGSQYTCLQYACLIVGSASFSLCSKESLSLIINFLLVCVCVCVFTDYYYYLLLCNYFVSYT